MSRFPSKLSVVAAGLLAAAWLQPGAAVAGGTDPGTALRNALLWLPAQQNPSGSWGGSYEFVDTAAAVETLGTVGWRGERYDLGLAWLTGTSAADDEELSRQILALAAAGGTGVAELAADLLLGRNGGEPLPGSLNWPEGGWGLGPGYGTDCLTTALALQALRAAGMTGGMAVRGGSVGGITVARHEVFVPPDAIALRVEIQTDRGGVRLRIGRGPDPSSDDADFSFPQAGVYQVVLSDSGTPPVPGRNLLFVNSPSGPASYYLHASVETPAYDTRAVWDPFDFDGLGQGALEYLLEAQNPDGGWGIQVASESDLYTSVHVILALEDLSDYDLTGEVGSGIGYLESQARGDGSFGSGASPSPYLTALAARAILRAGRGSQAAQTAVSALISLQDAQGSFGAQPYDTALAMLALADLGAVAAWPEIRVDPFSLYFGRVALGESGSRRLTVTNSGSYGLNVRRIAAGPGTGPEFAIAGAPATPFALAPGAGVEMELEYRPGDDGSDAGSLVIESDDPEGAVEIPLSGRGARKFHRGDANGDGAIFISDPVFILMYLFAGGPAPPCLEAANANDDAAIRLSDAIFLLAYLFRDTLPPPAPGPESAPCGPDPDGSPSDLGCASYPG